jgi:hypothetical protein
MKKNTMTKNTMTKKLFGALLVFFFAASPFLLHAQEDQSWITFPYNLGGGVDANMNTKEGWAQGWCAVVDRHLTRHSTLGIRGIMNTDYRYITNNEGVLFARIYPFKAGNGGAFTQLSLGVSSFQEEELRRIVPVIEIAGGYRFFFTRGFFRGFYLEGYIRSGFPYRWGGGILLGHWFNF